MTYFAIIVAGGKGTRLKSDIPKQFLSINNKPVLMHTIEKFNNCFSNIEIILVLPENQIMYWSELCKKHEFNIRHTITKGGETRFHSVKNGLSKTHSNSIIGIHDGVRPLVSEKTIKNCYAKAESSGAAIPVSEVSYSLRLLSDNSSSSVDRSKYVSIHTPQVFKGDILHRAYNQPYKETFTDDASVVEEQGQEISLISNNPENLKITTREDLIYAEAIFKAINN